MENIIRSICTHFPHTRECENNALHSHPHRPTYTSVHIDLIRNDGNANLVLFFPMLTNVPRRRRTTEKLSISVQSRKFACRENALPSRQRCRPRIITHNPMSAVVSLSASACTMLRECCENVGTHVQRGWCQCS